MRILVASITFGAVTFAAVTFAASSASAAVLSVGPGKTYDKPCAAFAAAKDGDTVEIDAAGSYDGDVCSFNKNNLTVRGKGGRAKIDAAGKNAGGKAIWVVQGSDNVFEDVELSGCKVPDANGAGIRQEGRNVTLRRVFFHDNENGILTGADPASTILIEDSEFARNGAGDGYSHNMYIGEVKSFTIRGSYSHHAKIGHLIKSRALENHILYNRLTDETGTASYEIDLPQGGKSFVIGNVIQQSATTDNPAFISFARESKRNAGSALFVVNNTFFNARSSGTFVAAAADIGAQVTLRNNIFAGPGTVCDQMAAIKDANFVGDPLFVDAAAYDFHLKSGSPAIDKGVAAGSFGGESLAVVCQYVHPTHAVVRNTVGTVDQGGFELGGESTIPCGGTAPGDAGPPDDASSDTGVSTTEDAAVDAETDSAPVDDATPSSPAAAPTEESSGCGCRVAGSARGSGVASLALLWLLARRRRSHRSARGGRSVRRLR